eukprot:scaffold107516_cov29-Tisochrysis_lutea.AAC.2
MMRAARPPWSDAHAATLARRVVGAPALRRTGSHLGRPAPEDTRPLGVCRDGLAMRRPQHQPPSVPLHICRLLHSHSGREGSPRGDGLV